MQTAIQMDQIAIAYGQPPRVKIAAAQREVLRDGGWTDVDAIIGDEPAAGGDGTGQAVAALQQLAQPE